MGGAEKRLRPLPREAAARRGGAGAFAAERRREAEGDFFALRDKVAEAAAGSGSRAREGAEAHDPRAKRRRAREEEAAARAAALELALHAIPMGVAKDTRGDIEAGFVAQARFRATHRPTSGFRRNGDRREAPRRVAVDDLLMSIMDEEALRRMAGCEGTASQMSREDFAISA